MSAEGLDLKTVKSFVGQLVGVKESSAMGRLRAKREDEEAEYVPVGVKGLVAASEKLLAVNRGVLETDQRESLRYKTFHSWDDQLRERVRLDANKVRLNAMRRAAQTKTLKSLQPYSFDGYMQGFLIGNPLSMPLEEINPMHMLEQAKRVTQMGPGGLGSEDVITESAQALNPSQFGFYDVIAGPESSKIGVDTRLANGVKIGSDGNLYGRFYDRRKKKFVWLNPEQVSDMTMKIPD